VSALIIPAGGADILGTANTFTAAQTITSTTSPQLTVAYDGTHSYTIGVASNGNVTLTPTGTLTTIAGAGGSTFRASATDVWQVGVQGTTGSSAPGFKLSNVGASGKYNWLIGAQNNVNNGLEITPSTAVDGGTFSSPVLSITNTGATTITSASGSALAVGPNGASNPSFIVDASNGVSAVTGLKVQSQLSGNGVYLVAVGGSNEFIVQRTGGTTAPFYFQNSAGATAFRIATVASGVNNVLISGTTSGNAPTIATDQSGVGIKLDANGAGVVSIATVSTGGVTMGGPVSVSTGTFNIQTGGSTTISTGVGVIHMSTANPATNAAWIPIAYAGTTYYVPGYTTNAP
jgi:hypothetical protein